MPSHLSPWQATPLMTVCQGDKCNDDENRDCDRSLASGDELEP